jgi:two-component system response regulator AtoC
LRILVVDDEKRMVESLRDYLALEGIEARTAGEGAEAERLLAEEPFDALVTDLRMPGVDGLSLLRWTREEGPNLPVVMISAHGEVSDAVEAMKLGAYDYLVKPFDPDELVIRIRKAVGERQALNRLEAGRSRYDAGAKLVGESPAMKEVRRLIEKAAPSGATILLTGESGTGKEVAAQLVHELSGRAGPFVPVNVGAVPENLLESELFGHEKGAFTGADSRRIGLFEAAQGGSLFLDEIGDLPSHLQVKLLRAIQERKIVRLGSTKDIPVDARLVAATNRDLEAEVQAGRFREDLYYRLNVIRIRLPPLRERAGDIGLLAGYFLKKLSGELGGRITEASPEAMAYLESMSFPGNVRELENAVERALILAEGPRLEVRDFAASPMARPAAMTPPPDPFAEPRSLAEVEKAAVAAALSRNAFYREKTAAELGITRRTLLNKIKEYHLEVPGRGDEE